MNTNDKPGAPSQLKTSYHPPEVKPTDPAAAAELVKAFAPKPGIKTTEFYLSVLGTCIPWFLSVPKEWAAIASAVAGAAYAVSRGLAKLRK